QARAVRAMAEASQNVRDRIERRPGFETEFLQLLRRQELRPERDLVVGVPRIEPPGRVEELPLRLHPPVEGRAGKWSQVVEGRDVEPVAPGELQGVGERLPSVLVVTEDEGGVQTDVVPPEVLERHLVAAAHRIEALVHLPQGLGIEALEADEQALTAA